MTEVQKSVTLFSTEVRNLAATKTGHEYRLSIWLPPSYDTTTTAFPVVYYLDGSLHTGITTNTTLFLIAGQEIPEVILVGIGYDYQGFADMGGHRNRDYTPNVIKPMPGSGQAAAFLSFLETELIPFVEATFRTQPSDRSIWGDSLGGLFVLYAFLERPRLFQRLIATSPAIFGDLPGFHRQMDVLPGDVLDQPARLFISVGELEEPKYHDSIAAFTQALRDKHFDHLTLNNVTLDNESHFSQIARGFVTGLRTVFAQETPVDQE